MPPNKLEAACAAAPGLKSNCLSEPPRVRQTGSSKVTAGSEGEEGAVHRRKIPRLGGGVMM